MPIWLESKMKDTGDLEFIWYRDKLFWIYPDYFSSDYLMHEWVPKEFEVGNSNSDINTVSVIIDDKRYVPK